MWTDTELLIALLDEVVAKYAVDPTCVYLIGYSMGGHGAWNLAYEHPERFAALAPMSGRANPWWATRIKDIPVRAFHGGKENTVLVSETLRMIEALRAEGADPKASIDPDGGHRLPGDAEHQAVFAWLLTHRKNAPKTGCGRNEPFTAHRANKPAHGGGRGLCGQREIQVRH